MLILKYKAQNFQLLLKGGSQPSSLSLTKGLFPLNPKKYPNRVMFFQNIKVVKLLYKNKLHRIANFFIWKHTLHQAQGRRLKAAFQ